MTATDDPITAQDVAPAAPCLYCLGLVPAERSGRMTCSDECEYRLHGGPDLTCTRCRRTLPANAFDPETITVSLWIRQGECWTCSAERDEMEAGR